MSVAKRVRTRESRNWLLIDAGILYLSVVAGLVIYVAYAFVLDLDAAGDESDSASLVNSLFSVLEVLTLWVPILTLLLVPSALLFVFVAQKIARSTMRGGVQRTLVVGASLAVGGLPAGLFAISGDGDFSADVAPVVIMGLVFARFARIPVSRGRPLT